MLRRIINTGGQKKRDAFMPNDRTRVSRHRRHSERGQVAVLFALVFTFMFVLFAMVVDFAHLVNNKINLQNAADAAAYSGAAWQAQALTRLSVLNYRLRQNVKELAMRLHVTHLRHNRNYPNPSARFDGPSLPQVEPFICQQAHSYSALSGLQYDANTNLCRNASPSVGGLPPIVIPPVIASFDPYAIAIQAQIRAIAEAADQECRAAADDNSTLARHLVSVYTARSRFHSQQMDSLVNWLNELGGGDIFPNQHPIARVALESARRNLTFANRDDFQMEILTPRGNEYIRMNEYRMRASIPFVNFNVVGGGCVGQPGVLDFDDMVAGKSKEQATLTYFAVKLSSRPRMLFMPQRWLDAAFPQLQAFAAAKPFGSRIGPDTFRDPLLPVPNGAGNFNRTVNFSFFPGDNRGFSNTKVMAYFNSLHPFNSLGRPEGNQQRGWPEPQKPDELRLALQAIRAPTMFDAIYYSALPDPNRTQDYEEQQFALALWPDYLEAAGTDNNFINVPQPATPPYFPTTGASRGEGWIPAHAPDTGARYGGIPYGQEQPSSHSIAVGVGLPDITPESASEFGFATREMVHSGWTAENAPGRIGYSVKFIGFEALVRTLRIDPGGSSGGEGGVPLNNPPTGDPNLVRIKH
jgi:hypothetical protein